MAIADRILDETPPGSVSAVVGRPGAGVSTVLEQICMTAAGSARVVLASWERPPASSDSADGVARPEVVAWSAAELGRCPEVREAGAGAVVAVDYLQLLSDPDEVAADALRAMTASRGWRLVLGVMAPRALKDLETGPSPASAAHRAGQILASVLQHVDRAAVITRVDASARVVTFCVPAAPGRSPRVDWFDPMGDGR